MWRLCKVTNLPHTLTQTGGLIARSINTCIYHPKVGVVFSDPGLCPEYTKIIYNVVFQPNVTQIPILKRCSRLVSFGEQFYVIKFETHTPMPSQLNQHFCTACISV